MCFPALPTRWPTRLLIAAVAILYLVTLLKTAWLSDDYFIVLRQIEQLLAGNGIRFNGYERIFLSTSVSYFFILLPLRFLTSDPFAMHGLFALTCNAALLWLLWLLARRDALGWLFGVGLLFASKAYFDFSWFGQENPLGHALAAALVLVWLRLYPGLRRAAAVARAPAPRDWYCFVALIAFAPLYRHDFVLLAWPLAAWALWDHRARLGWRGLVRTSALMLTPLLAWTAFSLVYFGFPLPSSAYNKLPDAHPAVWRLASALDYYKFSLLKDPATMAMLIGSQLLWLGSAPARVIAAGVLCVLCYVFFAGGDYMGGRFFTVAYATVVAVVVGMSFRWVRPSLERVEGRVEGKRRLRVGLQFALAAWIVAWPHAPLRSPLLYAEPVFDFESFPTGIADERAAWQPKTGVVAWWRAIANGTTYPDDVTARLGVSLAKELPADHTFHICSLGATAYRAGLAQNFLDIWGLADSLMTRLPAVSWRPGHFVRARPHGLEESLASGVPAFADAGLNEYFGVLRNVTGGEPLLGMTRMRHVVGMNLGLYDHLPPRRVASHEAAGELPAVPEGGVLRELFAEVASSGAAAPSSPAHHAHPLCRFIGDERIDAALRARLP